MQGVAEYLQLRVFHFDHAEKIEAVNTVQGDVEDTDVRLGILDLGHRRTCVQSRAADMEFRLPINECPQPLQKHRMIID